MTILRKLVIVTILYTWSVTVHAALMTTLVGNVNVLGSEYSLSILYDDSGASSDQSFNVLAPSITFNTVESATVAVNAIATAYPRYDWSPAFRNSNGTRVAFDLSVPDNYSYMTVFNNIPGGPFTGGPFTQPLTASNTLSFAQFTDISAVPIPATVWLFGTGVIGLIGFSKRRKAA